MSGEVAVKGCRLRFDAMSCPNEFRIVGSYPCNANPVRSLQHIAIGQGALSLGLSELSYIELHGCHMVTSSALQGMDILYGCSQLVSSKHR